MPNMRLALISAMCLSLATSQPTKIQPRAIWQPAVGAKWDINLSENLNMSNVNADIYDFDLFDNTGNTSDVNKIDTSAIDKLHKAGKKVICYFSAGTYEEWRPDASSFKASDKGSNMDDWPGETWLNLKSDNVAKIMRNRIALAAKAGCDAVDPDNMDAYDNNNGGINMQEEDSINFMNNVLAPAAAAAGMAIGLKNAASIIDSVIDNVQFQVNEECSSNEECADFEAFIKAGKPIFHIEYPAGESTTPSILSTSGLSKYCTKDASGANLTKFSTVIKLMNLNHYVQTCDGTVKYNY